MSDFGIKFEAKLTGHSKRADGGLNLRFQVHRDDVTRALNDACVGARYGVAIVEIDDNEQPVEALAQQPPPSSPDHPDKEGARKLYARIGILCREPMFHAYLKDVYEYTTADEQIAEQFVRDFCQVSSRRDILLGSIAEELFLKLENDFELWRMAPDLARRG